MDRVAYVYALPVVQKTLAAAAAAGARGDAGGKSPHESREAAAAGIKVATCNLSSIETDLTCFTIFTVGEAVRSTCGK